FADAIGSRCGENRPGRDGPGYEAAADPPETVAINQIGPAVLAERQQQRSTPASPGHVERQRVGAAEIGIVRVEGAPIVRRKIAIGIVVMSEIGGEPKDRLAVAPTRNIDRVAGG